MHRRLQAGWARAAVLLASTGIALAAERPLSPVSFEGHVAKLADDSMEGRAPGATGGQAAARYIASWFQRSGLDPLADGGYLMDVPLIGWRVDQESDSIAWTRGSRETALPRSVFAARTESLDGAVDLSAPVVFVGHGISWPDLGWDDYEGVDAEGKLVAVRAGFPPGEHSYAAREDAKLAAARAAGARGVLFLVSDEPEEAVAATREHWLREQLDAGWRDEPRLDVVAWVDAGHLPDTPEGDLHVAVRLRQNVRRLTAPNVVGILPGADPEAGAVLLTAHYDAYGIGPADESGDSIFNGALDNATGVGALIELARHFSEREERLPRTLVFLATTAEEYGKLGARHYVDHPVVPLAETVVVLNLDGINVFAPTEDFIVFPSEGVEASAHLARIAEASGMRLSSEPWQRGMHFSFDTEPFLLRGLAGLTLWQGSTYRGMSAEEGRRRRDRFGQIHTPADAWRGEADHEAIAQHLELYRIAVETFGRDVAPPAVSLPHP